MSEYIDNLIRLTVVKQIFPNAIRAWASGKCPNCKQQTEIFFITEPQSPDSEGFIQGGAYCPRCKFSNSAKMNIDKILGK